MNDMFKVMPIFCHFPGSFLSYSFVCIFLSIIFVLFATWIRCGISYLYFSKANSKTGELFLPPPFAEQTALTQQGNKTHYTLCRGQDTLKNPLQFYTTVLYKTTFLKLSASIMIHLEIRAEIIAPYVQSYRNLLEEQVTGSCYIVQISHSSLFIRISQMILQSSAVSNVGDSLYVYKQ